MPPGPTLTGYPYQPVLQSAQAAPSSVCHDAVPRGRALKITHLPLQKENINWIIFSKIMKSSSFLQVLEADNNKIENLEGVYQLPKLEEVHLRNNSILACVTEVFGFLIFTFKSFVRIYCALLPVADWFASALSVRACYFQGGLKK